jgi:hypothetical protein
VQRGPVVLDVPWVKTSMHSNQRRSTLFLKVTVIGMFGAAGVADLRALRFSPGGVLTAPVIHAFTSNLPERVCSGACRAALHEQAQPLD